MKAKTILVLAVFVILLFNQVFGSKLNVSSKIKSGELLRPVKIIVYNNQIYLLDNEDHAVKGFTKSGKILVSVGQKGQGPGECVTPVDFQVYDNKIFILDASINKIEVFSLKNGKHIKTQKIWATNSIRLSINSKGKSYLAALKFIEGQKLISELIYNGGLQAANSFLNCKPLKGGDITGIYNNFGFLASSEDRVYFAYTITNEILEFSLKGDLLKKYSIPLEPLDLKKLFKNNRGPNTILKEALNYDLKVKDKDVYLLSRDEKKNTFIIFKLENGEFKEKYTMDEKLISFDICDDELWAIEGDEMDILRYKITGKRRNI